MNRRQLLGTGAAATALSALPLAAFAAPGTHAELDKLFAAFVEEASFPTAPSQARKSRRI
jgi:hypothetical protein